MNGSKIIDIAVKYLGDTGKKTCSDYGLPWGSHWCCAFVWDIFRIADASELFFGGQKTAYVPTAQAWLAAHCDHVSLTNAKAGDIVIFTWTGGGYNKEQGTRDHIGFVRKKGTSKTVYTIEGNTGASDPRRSHVMKRTRDARYIFAIYRPNYKTDKKKAEDKPKEKSKKTAIQKIKARYKVVSALGMNIRKKPTEDSKRVGGIGYGKTFKATKKKGSWVYGRYGKTKGWVCTKKGSTTYMIKK
ncbi:CHAP domain-containing protein [Candidatus Saccharibacteria bacterium]|nr:CHAP domain-containing protein [Candidatus Saccharibacteria bacterium]